MEGLNPSSETESGAPSAPLPQPIITDPPVPTPRLRYPSLEDIYSSSKPSHVWQITRGEYNEQLLTSFIPDGHNGFLSVSYDINEGCSVDLSNRSLAFVSPPESFLVADYLDKVRKSHPPACKKENGVLHLRGAPHIIFNTDSNSWINTKTKRIITGFSKPLF